MKMVKFEIVGVKGKQIRVYLLITVVVLFLSLVFCENEFSYCEGDELVRIILGSFIFLTLFSTIVIMPNIPYRKQEKMGDIGFSASQIVLYKESETKSFSVTDITNIKVRLLGFDGQHRFVNSRSLKNSSFLPNFNPRNGLGNRIIFKSSLSSHAYEFYVTNSVDYNLLKDCLDKWSKKDPSIRKSILR